MDNLSPLMVDVAVAGTGLLLYAMLWYVSRDMSRFAKVLARLAPLTLIVPILIVLSPQVARQAAPRLGQKPPDEVARVEESKPVQRRYHVNWKWFQRARRRYAA